MDFGRDSEGFLDGFLITFSKQRFHENDHPPMKNQHFQGLEAPEIDENRSENGIENNIEIVIDF